jgi:hypothetical protein
MAGYDAADGRVHGELTGIMMMAALPTGNKKKVILIPDSVTVPIPPVRPLLYG